MKSEDLAEHELECECRQVPCPEAFCQVMMEISHLNAHYQEMSNSHDLEGTGEGEVILMKSKDTAVDVDQEDWLTLFCLPNGFRFHRVFVKRENT